MNKTNNVVALATILSGAALLAVSPLWAKKSVSNLNKADAAAMKAAYTCLKLTERQAPANEADDYQALLNTYNPKIQTTPDDVHTVQRILAEAETASHVVVLATDQSELFVTRPSFTAQQVIRCFSEGQKV